ncbi:MAG: carbon storage regulator CsrA [Planctomycetia bacterium]|nr:carbon storage regulator CsrA [Planctomycetia bacterium]
MLVLTRKQDESIIINGEIEVIITSIGHNKVRIGIQAPSNVSVHRKEVFKTIEEKKVAKSSKVQTKERGLSRLFKSAGKVAFSGK